MRYDFEKEYFEHVFWVCGGRCDEVLTHYVESQNRNLINGWEDVSDIMIPTIFIKWVMSIMNQQRSGVEYSDEAFENLKEFLLQVFPYVSRCLTSNE